MSSNVPWYLIALLIVVSLSVVSCGKNNQTQHLSEKRFPSLYKMDDFYNCSKPENFCSASLRLSPILPFDDYHKFLEKSSNSYYKLNRTIVIRTLCIPEECKEYNDKKEYIENRVNKEVEIYNLTAKMYKFTCFEPTVNQNNIFWHVVFMVSYIGLMAFATIYEQPVLSTRKEKSKFEEILKCFSLTNFEKTSVESKPDFSRLKCMQGFRSIQAVFVITGHVLLNQVMKPLSNPEYLEQILTYHILEYFVFLLFIVLSTFFMYSNWLLTNFILQIHKRNGEFSLRDAAILFFSRIFRTWPILYMMIFIIMPVSFHFGYGPGTFVGGNFINEGCDKNWWVTFLMATNFIKSEDSCHLGMWSLSLDAQFFLVTIVFWYIVLKFKLNIKNWIFGLFIFAFGVSAFIAYKYETRVEQWISLKQIVDMNYLRDERLVYSYFGFWVNFPSNLIGMIFGYYYFKSNDEGIKKEPLEKYYKTIFYSIPPAVICVSYVNYSRLGTAFMVPLMRICFNTAIAVGVYGLSKKIITGRAQKIFENKYLVMLGNYTFCTYIFHFFFVFTKGHQSTQLHEFSVLKVAFVTTVDVIVCFLIGIITTILFAAPVNNLKKFIIPSPMRGKDIKYNNYCQDKLSDGDLQNSAIKNKYI